MFTRILTFIFFFIAVSTVSFAQDKTDEQEEPQDKQFTVDTPVTLDFEKEEKDEPQKKKKKPKKKVFYGIKTKKGFTRKGYGDKVTYEIFFFLKRPELPQTFVRDVYWFNFKRKEIVKTAPSSFDPRIGVL